MITIEYLIANYNNEKYISDCLDSLTHQTTGQWKAIICDDCSTDNSVSIIESYISDQVSLIRNDVNVGYIQTLKNLIESSTNETVAILDADDALEPNATEELIKAYSNNPETSFIYTNCARYDEELNILLDHSFSKPPYRGNVSLIFGFISGLRSFKKALYYEAGGYNDAMIYSEDRDLTYKLEELTFPYFIDMELYKYRFNPKGQSKDVNKALLGFSNYRKARMEALVRRNIYGIEKLWYSIYFYSDYMSSKHALLKNKLRKKLHKKIRLKAGNTIKKRYS